LNQVHTRDVARSNVGVGTNSRSEEEIDDGRESRMRNVVEEVSGIIDRDVFIEDSLIE
jgi:hypothetical protein